MHHRWKAHAWLLTNEPNHLFNVSLVRTC
uniref:Uncharacterized protein n=1 Tax=Anguilla anguilla TaxID=7936 RepID=A0A0E9XXC7_ANGAN